MDGEKLFKSSMRGFNKEDVTMHIGGLNRKISVLQEEKAKLAADCDKLLSELEVQKKKAGEMDGEHRAALREIQTVRERVSFVDTRYSELQHSFESASLERDALSKENASFKERNELLEKKCADYESRARIFDSGARELADVMVQARQNADQIVAAAREDAAARKVQAEQELARTLADYRAFKNKLLSLKSQALATLADAANRVSVMDSFLHTTEESTQFIASCPKDGEA